MCGDRTWSWAAFPQALSQKDTDTQQQTTGRASLEGELQQLRDELQAAQAALEEKVRH